MKIGVSYYPELVDHGDWARDLDYIRESKMTTIRAMEFAWCKMEPREGVYDWQWLDRFLDMCHERELEVVMCTPTATPPTWFIRQYPEAMIMLRDGTRRTYGTRRDLDLASPIYRFFSRQIAEALGRRYGNHPAVIGWQIDNELMGPELAPPETHSPAATFEFRQWLKRKYNGDIHALNEAWGLAFWSLDFSDWGEVITPTHPRHNDGHIIDYQHWFSDLNVEYLKLQYDALRSTISEKQWVSHNSTGVFNLGINQADYERALDFGGWDAYLGAASAGCSFKRAWSAMATDWFRGTSARPVMIFETNPADKNQTMAHMADLKAHGSNLVCFWQWRSHRYSMEKGAQAVADLAGRPFEEKMAFVQELCGREEILHQWPDKLPRPKAALVWDCDNQRNELHKSPFSKHNDRPYMEAVIQLYQPFWQAGVLVDVVGPGADLSPYSLVLLPSMRLMDEEVADWLRQFVSGGGILYATAKTAQMDSLGKYHKTPGEILKDVLGISMRMNAGGRFLTGPNNTVRLAGGEEMEVSCWADRMWNWDESAEVLATFVGGEMDGLPALMKKTCGKGTGYYQAAMSAELARTMTVEVAKAAGIEASANPCPDVSICPDLLGRGTWYMNHSEQEQEVDGVKIPAREYVFVEK